MSIDLSRRDFLLRTGSGISAVWLSTHWTAVVSAATHARLALNSSSASFFETLRFHTVVAFLIDPEFGGNRDGVGWKVIGREPDHMFQPPFGYYDKDYAGWQPNPPDSEKAKA